MPKKEPTQAAYLENPPHCLRSEKTIIGCVILGESQWLRTLTPAHFYERTNAIIFAALQKIQADGKEPDFLEICNALEGNEEIEKIGGSAYLAELSAGVISTALAPSAIRIIQEKYSKRCAIEAGRKMQAFGADNDHDVQTLPQLLAEASRRIAEVIPRPIEVDKAAIITDIQRVDDRIPTGFPEMDQLFKGGLAEGWYFLIAARPSVGKSALAATMMANFLKAGVSVSFLSLEMSQKQIMMRMLGAYYEIFEEEVIEKAADLVNRIDTPYYIHTDHDISAILQEIYTTPAKVIIIDYFGLIRMKGNTKGNETQIRNEISRSIKIAATETGKPIIVLWQLNRDVEKDKGNRQPRLSDLYGGGEQDPDQVSFLHNPNAKDDLGQDSQRIKEALAVKDPVQELEWIVRKNRHGACGYMRLLFKQKKSLMITNTAAYSTPKTTIVHNYKSKDQAVISTDPDRTW